MKRLKNLICCIFITCSCLPSLADDSSSPKQELRAVWVSPMGCDWPQERNRDTTAQKQEAIIHINRLKSYGFNCIFLHVRQMADRIYLKNTFNGILIDEPFSEYVTGKRDTQTEFDPLAFWITECHRRGMELHAWINPYRFCNIESRSIPDKSCNPRINQSAFDNKTFDSGHIISHTIPKEDGGYMTYYIFNPALQETTNRIADICTVILNNYDVDGIVFDDWFYPNGISNDGQSSGDYSDYNKYILAGGTDNIADWRRNNVNQMISTINSTIKSIKPWVRFGISPAGAAGKGIIPSDSLPDLSHYCQAVDWQYDGIFSDPIAWLREKSIDYIAPQLYWKTNHPTNPFYPMAQWWNIVANRFGRHFYASNSIRFLSPETDAAGNIIAINNTDENRQEVSDQITFNRKAAELSGGVPGIITFSAGNISGSNLKGVGKAIKSNNNLYPALIPAMTWQQGYNPGKIHSFTRNGATLKWSGYENVRYTVYAFPDSLPLHDFNKETKYLVDITYDTSFTIPDSLLSGYNYALCIYDRYGNEYDHVLPDPATKKLPAPVLTFPAEKCCAEIPFVFTWEKVPDATNYIIEIAREQSMDRIIQSRATNRNCFPTSGFDTDSIPLGIPLYWRVRSCADYCSDGISDTNTITFHEQRITHPLNGATDVCLTPAITCSMPERETTLQLSTSPDFSNGIIFSGSVNNGIFQVPNYMLSAYTTYYARLLHRTDDGIDTISRTYSFSTTEMTPDIPAILTPIDEGILYSNQQLQSTPVEGANKLRIEVSETLSFASRLSYITENISTMDGIDRSYGSQIRLNGKPLDNGKKYYVRTRASYNSPKGTQSTDYSQSTTFYYSSSEAGLNNTSSIHDSFKIRKGFDNQGNASIIVEYPGTALIHITDTRGRKIGQWHHLGHISTIQQYPVNAAHGIYIVTISSDTIINTAKMQF